MNNLHATIVEDAEASYGLSESEAKKFADEFSEDIKECMWMEYDYKFSEYMEEYRRNNE